MVLFYHETIRDQGRHMHPIKPKGLSLGLGFHFFEYLGFGFGLRYFANLLQILIQKRVCPDFT